MATHPANDPTILAENFASRGAFQFWLLRGGLGCGLVAHWRKRLLLLVFVNLAVGMRWHPLDINLGFLCPSLAGDLLDCLFH